MQDMTRALMHSTFSKLTPDQFDDLESQFDNLEVLFERIVEKSHDNNKTHVPAIELHAGEITETLFNNVVTLLESKMPVDDMLMSIKMSIWDYMKGCILFGMEVGKVGWPVTELSCEEVH